MKRIEEELRMEVARWLVKEKLEAGYDVEIPSLGVVIIGDRKLLTDETKRGTNEDYKGYQE